MKVHFALVLALVSACFPSAQPANPGMAAWSAAAATPAQDSPTCSTMIQQLDACPARDEHAQITQPSPDDDRSKAQLDQVLSMSRQGMKTTCPKSDLAPHFANQDKCIADARESYKHEQAEQLTRLPAERKRTASVKQDPKYGPALDRLRRALADHKRAVEDLEDAKQREGLDCGRSQDDCRRTTQLQDRIASAEHDSKAAESDLRELAITHHIDERDGEELGLW